VPGISSIVILVLGALTAFAPLSIDMYLPSLPTLERELAAPASAVKLTLSAFLIGLAAGQLLYGPLSDRFGRKAPLISGVALYTVASVGCAYAATVEALIALRVLQALGGCAGMVITRAIVRDMVDGPEAARLFSTLMLVMGVAPILAPLLGGYVLIWFGWSAIFWFLALFGAVCLAGIALILPETRPPHLRTQGGVGATLATYGRLLTSRRFLGFVLSTGFPTAGMFVYITASPHLLIGTHGVPAEAYGWVFGANAAGLIGASQFNRLLLRRLSVERMLALGVAIYLAGALILLTVALADVGGLPALLAALFLTIASLGTIMPNAAAAALAGEAAHAGSASALIGTLPFVIGALAGAAVAALPSGSALAMAGVIAGCAALGFLANRTLARPAT
jgi:DHA1 family bicyclomycin/chloramphenicol resistance-like MFS transporter